MQEPQVKLSRRFNGGSMPQGKALQEHFATHGWGEIKWGDINL